MRHELQWPMGLVGDLWGWTGYDWDLATLKKEILKLPPIWSERKSYLLHDWARVHEVKLKHQDFVDVGAHPQTK